MHHATIVALRLIHIVMGSLWFGSVAYTASFTMPSLAKSGPAGAVVMDQLVRVLKLPRAMMTYMALTILSGLGLMGMVSGGPDWFRSRFGMGISTGAALAIVASLVGVTVNMPTGRKVGALAMQIQASGAGPTAEQAAEMARLQARMSAATRATAVLLGLAAAAMGTARYL